ncbi:hypothetical protein RSOLAG1IB_08640 [Rhizoctonia solani AG-1 IB]|uniref:Uncharacterized protein n=1 Tax=Thanatephorus cucumeris (strain AG1-IB / isolate 7/3/14) TaxID=1108050 RepID=A0A0B7FLM8_THACB|nr:hypothetical protein RSOLAG1IB_08640 [Rhizoctonia solani AG-1 IB]
MDLSPLILDYNRSSYVTCGVSCGTSDHQRTGHVRDALRIYPSQNVNLESLSSSAEKTALTGRATALEQWPLALGSPKDPIGEGCA